MTDSIELPRCFDTPFQAIDWQRPARVVMEPSCICDDCSAEYESRMRDQFRCDKKHWAAVIFGASAAVNAYRRALAAGSVNQGAAA